LLLKIISLKILNNLKNQSNSLDKVNGHGLINNNGKDLVIMDSHNHQSKSKKMLPIKEKWIWNGNSMLILQLSLQLLGMDTKLKLKENSEDSLINIILLHITSKNMKNSMLINLLSNQMLNIT